MGHIKSLYALLSRKERKQLIWLVFFSVFVSVVETAGISVIMPFIEVATNFENIYQKQHYRQVFDFFNFESSISFSIAFGIVLIIFYIFRGGFNLLYSYTMAQFSYGLYAQITKRLFKAYLSTPYQSFTHKNSSYLTKTIVTEASLVSTVISSILLMVSEIFIIIFLYILMLVASWEITLAFTAILTIKLLFLTNTVSKKIKKVGQDRERIQASFYEIVNKVFGNFKQIKLQDKSRIDVIKGEFSKEVDQYAKSNTTYHYLDSFPRLFLETSGFVLIVALLVILIYLDQGNVSNILPTLTLFVLALYRLLPSVNRIVSGYNALMYYHKSIDVVEDELKITQENLKDAIVEFYKTIELNNVAFSYQEKEIFHDVNLTINKGDKVAFIGESGSGKSTLVDLIIGLDAPTLGEIKIDDIVLDECNFQSWRSQIGYIPQHVYLFDGSVRDNICFGRDVDEELVELVARQARVSTFLQDKQGLDTLVGEGGIQLSGGQKQRIAIARALYGKPEILVLDEATSSLDNETEQKIMSEIYGVSKDKTLIIVAHRLSTIEGCNRVYTLDRGLVT